jgi:hypothetical protein
MNDELKKAVAKSQAALRGPFTKEREQYKALLLSNPNYFGSLASSSFTPVLPLAGNTFYEELVCVGYQPQQERLEAVVHIYQPSGYGSNLCGGGSTEYVRFYLSFDQGATWVDQGLTSFQAWNIPQGTDGSKRLEYAVQLHVNPARKFCFTGAQLIKTRAILSWNAPPPPNQPNWNPPWGNHRDATIQVEPRRLFIFKDLLETTKIKLPALFKDVIDLEQPVPTKVNTLAATDLAVQYKAAGIPVHRFAFKEIHALTATPQGFVAEMAAQMLPGIEIPANIGDLLFPKTDGDTSYEELRCIGLDPNSPDTLIGVLKIKRSQGYSGGPCTTGSTEYVSWWADFDGNGSFESFLGTAQVQVHDLPNIPAEGVSYAVRLPVDFSIQRQICKKGPVLVPIRAILSWNAAVPGNQPNKVPTWGNREETLIHIAPTGVVHAPAGEIAILGGIPVSMINDTTGLTTPDALFALNNAAVGGGCAFGAAITLQGAPLPNGYTYKVEVTPVGGSVPTPVLTELTLTRQDGSTYQSNANPVTQRFAYQQFNNNVGSLMAIWYSAGDAQWTVALSTYDPGGNLLGVDTQRIQLDNTGPTADINITTGTGNCGKFPTGAVIGGTFVARDLHLLSYSIGVKPPDLNDPGEAITTPSAGTMNTAVLGDAWSLDTAGMVNCGYVVEVVVRDSTIVSSQSQGWYSAKSVGFCLEAAVDGPA